MRGCWRTRGLCPRMKIPFLTDGPSEVFWFDFAAGTISGMLFSVLAMVFVLPVFLPFED